MRELWRTSGAVFAVLLLCLSGCSSRYSAADIQAIREQAYQSGYDAGVSSGQADGYAQGAQSGYAEGYAQGYDVGYSEGQGALRADQEPPEGDLEDPASEGSAETNADGGYSDSTTVYVSKSGKKIHLKPDCSGMKNYTTMTLGQADANGYARCSRCFS
jgi:hypothetical protein